MPNTNRRWPFSFSLRTLFVLVTVLCCWLGWEVSVVRQRRAVLKEAKANPAFQIVPAAAWRQRYSPGTPPTRVASIPRWRTWLGDEAIQEIVYFQYAQGYSETQLTRLKTTFPEAEAHEIFPEPCHPGCFPLGTLVETPQGSRAIENIVAGDVVTIVLANGESATAQVQTVFVTENRLWQVETTQGTLITTQTQPLCIAADRTQQVGDLQPGDTLLRWQNGEVRTVTVLGVSATDQRAKVFNLILGDKQIFIANGYLARSKPPLEVDLP